MSKRIIFNLTSLIFILCTLGCASSNKKEKEIKIVDLVKEGRIDEAKSYFVAKYNINDIDEEGNSALHIAAKDNDSSLTLFLLCYGADPDLKNYNSQTPLHCAIEANAKDSARQLVNFGCNIFARDGEEVTALDAGLARDEGFYDILITTKTGEIRDTESGKFMIHYFVETKNEQAVNYCIRKEIPVTVKDNSGLTPLAYAYKDMSDISSVNIAAALISAGAEHVDSNYDYFETAVLNRNIDYRFDDGQTALHLAAIKGHRAIAQYLITNHAKTDSQDSSGATPLHEAVRYGHTEIAKLILDAGADVNAKDNLGKSPLLLISPTDSRGSIYSLLITYGANVKDKDMYGDTVLHTATMLSVSTDILRSLLNAGAEINSRNKDGVTPLALAIENKVSEHIKFYADNGADINTKDTKGNTPLIMAIKSSDGSENVLEMIVNSKNINSVDSEGNSPLIVAIQYNASLAKVKYIISLTDNVNTRNADGNTALYLTVLKNRQKVGELLLAKDADIFATNNRSKSPLSLALYDGGSVMDWLITSKTIKATDGSGNTALHFAAEWDLKEALLKLIAKGAYIEAKNANGETPLFSAAKTDNPTIIHILYDNGCKINIRDNLGSTPLHHAVRWGNPKSVAKLIALGCNIEAQNVSGKSALSEAALGGKVDIARLLLEKGANPNTSDTNGITVLMDSIRAQNIDLIKLLLSFKANPQIQELNGRNSYHEASITANKEIIDLIRNAGGNPLSRDKNGNTPFSLSLDQNETIISAVLGTDKNIADSDGNSPIHIVVKNKKHPDMLKKLIAKGYPFDTRNADGYTPLSIAVEEDNKTMSIILLENGANPFIAIDGKGKNAVTIALNNNKSSILENIVKYAGNSVDIQGNSILHYAARSSSEDMVKKLLSYGLDPTVKNIYDETPYVTAIRWKRNNIASLLSTGDDSAY